MNAFSDSGLTRESLLSRARACDSAAWHELVDLYGPLVAHWCRRCRLDDEQVADCVQEVFASVTTSLASYRPLHSSGAFRGWLWTITKNKIRDLIRKHKTFPHAAGGSTALRGFHHLVEIPDDEPTDEVQISSLVRRATEQVKAEFEPRTWDIFRRVVFDQIATAVVAEEFGISAAGVRQIRSRVLRRLRQQLGDIEL